MRQHIPSVTRLVTGSVLMLSLASALSLPQLPTDLTPIAPADIPPSVCNWFSLQRFLWCPPLPGYWLGDQTNIVLYVSPSQGTNAIYVGDQDVDYAQRYAQAQVLTLAAQAALGRLPMDDSSNSGTGLAAGFGGSLWLEITNVAAGLAYLNLHNATNEVYAIWSTTNLPGSWNVETEVWPTDTNCDPFTVLTQDRPNLYLLAEDWTGVTENGNTTPDWWLWQYFGTTALSDTNLDSQGNTLLYDYQNGLDPNVIQFTLAVTNQYVNSTAVPVQLSVLGGSPSYIAILVNDTNTADASWQPFTSTNLWVSTPTDGAYVIAVGLCGPAKNATLTWQCVTIVRDTTPLTLVLTNLAALSGSRPFIDPAGYATRSLSALSWTLLDAHGGMSGGKGAVVAKSWNLADRFHRTNWFQCVDLPLALGTNQISIQAVDWAGNMAITNFAYVFDTNGDITLPALTMRWPQDGTLVSGNSFTFQAWMDDDTASVALQYTNADGTVQTVNGLVERGGNVWVEGVPLAGGTNGFSLTATDAAGNVSTTNFSVVQSSVALTIAPLTQEQMQYGYATVMVAVGGLASAVTVNGVAGASSDGQNWEVDNVPLPPGGTVTLQATARMADGTVVQSLAEEERDPVVFTQVYDYNLDYSALTWTSDETNGFGKCDIQFLWERGGGGNYTKTGSWIDYDTGHVTSYSDITVWPPDNGYLPILPGQEVICNYDDGELTSTFTNTVPPPSVEWVEHSASAGTWPDNFDAIWAESSDREVRLFTGGNTYRQRQGLFDLSAALTWVNQVDPDVPDWGVVYAAGGFLNPEVPPVAVPSEDITLGALGPLGPDGHLWTVQPDGIEVVITPQVLSCWSAHACMAAPTVATGTRGGQPTQQKSEPVITANGITLDPDSVTSGADFCVGQGITFAIAGLPRYRGAEAEWKLSGTYVNTNSDPNCDLFYEKNTALLTRLSWRDKTLSTTPCWYVLDAANAQVSVTVTFYFRNEGSSFSFNVTGKFNVHRPTATFISPSSIDGTPTVMLANGSLSLGDGNRHNDMSFGHNINPGNFSGQAGYVQLVSGEWQTDPEGIPLVGTELDTSEFPRGKPAIPANTNSPVSFYDGPHVPLADNDTETSEDLSFQTYLLFKPDAGPGPNIFVPLRLVTWELHDSATYTSGTWSAHTGSPVPSPSDNDCTSFPDWTRTYGGWW